MIQLTPSQIRRGMRFSIIDAIFANPFYGLTWAAGVFMTGCALTLGANNFEIGLLSSLAPLLSGGYLIGAWFLERLGTRKKFYGITAAIHRAVFFGVLLLPFISTVASPRIVVAYFLAIAFISIFVGTFQTTAWISWMADMVPADQRGSFFSRRNMISGAVWMGLSFLFGMFIDNNNTVTGYAIVFSIGTLLALFSLFFVLQQPEPPMILAEKKSSFLALWKNAYALPQFRNFLFFFISWGFATGLAAPFYNVYMLKELHITIAQITVLGILGGIIGTIAMPYWGLLSDKTGNKPVLLFALLGSCITAAGWLFLSGTNQYWLLPMLFIFSGFFDTGIGLITFNMLLGIMPEQNKPSYIALFESVVGTCSGFAPAIGGFIALNAPALPHYLPQISAVFLVIVISTTLRIVPLLFLGAIPSQRGRGIGFVVREFVLTNQFKLLTSLNQVHKSPKQKLSAISTMSTIKSKVALPDLIASIHDLNPRVRQQALRAIGTIGDRSAFDALVQALSDPLEDIQAEAALALGHLGDLRAVAPLRDLLKSSDNHLLNSAISALGELKAEDTIDDLLLLLRATSRTSTMIAAADALSRMAKSRVVEPLLEASRLSHHESIKRSLVASAGMMITHKDDLYKALSVPEAYCSRATAAILNPATVKFARSRQSPLRKNIARAIEAVDKKNYNEAIVEMKMLNQVAVREVLAQRELKEAMGFEAWVKLLDSPYSLQLIAVDQISGALGIALHIVDYYARHCPAKAEPDMDVQEFLLALYAFAQCQTGIYHLVNGQRFFEDVVAGRLAQLAKIVSVD